MTPSQDWADLGVSTIYEAAGQEGLLDVGMRRIVDGTSAAGRARTVLCGRGDNEGIHRAIDVMERGEVLVVATPTPEPVALFGDVLAVFAKARGAAAVMVDGAVRDVDELGTVGLPVWARWVTSHGPGKGDPGVHNEPVTILGQRIAPGDLVVLDGDGVVVVAPEREPEVLEAARTRAVTETDWVDRLGRGESTLDLLGLSRIEEQAP